MKRCELKDFIKICMGEEKCISLSNEDFSRHFNIIGLDSLSIIILLCEIEDHFNTKCNLEAIDFTRIQSLDDLINHLCGDNIYD